MNQMNLKEKEKNSIYIIREMYAQEKNLALLWSMGKDSTVLLWLMLKAFFGEIPFPVVHIDTTYKFPEMYKFRDYYAKEWGVNLIIKKNESALRNGVSYDNTKATDVCHKLKTEPLKDFVREHKLRGLFVGIRSDEHNIRAKEQVVSIRDKNFNWDYKNNIRQVGDIYKYSLQEGEHLRIHPIIEWTEEDIWIYIKSENIPVCELYFAKNGKRYRSLGCQPITKSVNSMATTVSEIISEIDSSKETERSGRLQDKEDKLAMQKLRSLGYM